MDSINKHMSDTADSDSNLDGESIQPIDQAGDYIIFNFDAGDRIANII